ncbi:MAG: hypothetical protein C0392_07370 [Syntrophus sp. (in: bacteria)]|nr:hypothetical protein [Syntrophus sp. (in: bacteria)]
MKEPIDLETKLRDKIVTQYPALDKTDIPKSYVIKSIDYRTNEIEEYHVIFWHRLLRGLYQEPLEVECELHNYNLEQKAYVETAAFRRTQEKNRWEVSGIDEVLASEIKTGKIKPLRINWKYLIRLPSGGIVECGTKDRTTVFHIALVIRPDNGEKNHNKEAKKFVDLVLNEANRVRRQLFNPTKEFEKQDGIRSYLLFNIYLSNYRSAETMLGIAEPQETVLLEELLRYDARTSDLWDEEKRKHIEKHMLTCGMFYCSAITYFIMALEGFVNVVYHAFLNKKFRDKDFRTEQRFDLEQKIMFMPALCNGFNENSVLPSTILPEFKMLKNYRNSLFHSKVEDSLQSLCFVDGGFLYTYDMDAHKDRFLPSYKIKLTVKDVIEVKSKVDEIVDSILKSMDKNTRMLTENFILKKTSIPFTVLEAGEIVLGGIKQA